MPNKNNLVLIQYPSGGYGYYLARLINRYITGVVKVRDLFDFDGRGTSHSLPLVYGNIHFNQHRNLDLEDADPIYHDAILRGDFVLVPCCPGINDDLISVTQDYYPEDKIIRLCYDDRTWPLVFFNSITKPLGRDINSSVFFDRERFGTDAAWARRENFYLLCKYHNLRHRWKAVPNKYVLNVNVFSLLTQPDQVMTDIADFLHRSRDPLSNDLCHKHKCFLSSNPATVLHLRILDLVNNLSEHQDLGWITELFWQGVMNFYIEEQYDCNIRVNDYPDWFSSTLDIHSLIKDQRTHSK